LSNSPERHRLVQAVHRSLVQELMHRGWYRVGADPADADGRVIWHFRHGHRTDGEPGQEVGVRASSEVEAMRALLNHLRHQVAAASPAQAKGRNGGSRGGHPAPDGRSAGLRTAGSDYLPR
jgi:hypothetical protein